MVVKSARTAPGHYVRASPPNPRNVSVENNFVGGLKTEFTGLNFPENACTNASNCVFSLIGDVTRRGGIDFEANAVQQHINTTNNSISSYRWRNAGGDGQTEILIEQVGATLYFFKSSSSTTASPLSNQLLASTVNLNTFLVTGSPNNPALAECTYADGNGYLFVYHPYCETFYCTLSSGIVAANQINIKIRDFNGIPDGLGIGPSSDPNAVTIRPAPVSSSPATTTPEHLYNLINQGWTNATPFSVTSHTDNLTLVQLPSNLGTNVTLTTGTQTFTLTAAPKVVPPANAACLLNVSFNFLNTDNQLVVGATCLAPGTIVSYNSTTFVLTVQVGNSTVYNSQIPIAGLGSLSAITTKISSTSAGNTINTWVGALGLFPSNADVWWVYKDTSGNFSSSSITSSSVTPASSPAPQGHFLYSAFNINPSQVSGITGLTTISTNSRCTNGTWFAGRVWFTGINAAQPATGDQPYYTWTENIYFSQVITTSDQFGYCFQVNDPTNQNLFEILPTDGGVITIPGTGAIYKLFPITNGLLVFAQNGVWFITGGQSLGFTATDYSINKISNVQSISSTSFINVLGMPLFWNQEGIYNVEPSQQNAPYTLGGLKVTPITVGTILTYYNNIPLDSKRYARGDYDPNTYILQWVYRATQETGISNRYDFDTALSLNIYTKSFYPYTFAETENCMVNGVVYMTYPNSAGGLSPQFKYLTTVGSNITFSEENNFNNYVDWFTFDGVGVNYVSTFTTGYKLHGQGYRRWNPIYIYMFLRNTTSSSYIIQGIWDFASSSVLGRTSNVQTIVNYSPLFNMVYNRHKLRGHGVALQIQVSSVTGLPFDIMGWSVPEIAGVGA